MGKCDRCGEEVELDLIEFHQDHCTPDAAWKCAVVPGEKAINVMFNCCRYTYMGNKRYLYDGDLMKELLRLLTPQGGGDECT